MKMLSPTFPIQFPKIEILKTHAELHDYIFFLQNIVQSKMLTYTYACTHTLMYTCTQSYSYEHFKETVPADLEIDDTPRNRSAHCIPLKE